MTSHYPMAVESLFRQYYQALLAYAVRIIGDTAGAEDVVQDVFLAIWTNRDELDPDGNIRSYLFSAVYRRCLNYLALKHNTAEDSLDLLVDSINLQHAVSLGPEDFVVTAQLRDEVSRFVESLSPQAREIFLSSRDKGMKIKDIAAVLEISPKTVEKHLYRSLADLRMLLVRGGFMALLIAFYDSSCSEL